MHPIVTAVRRHFRSCRFVAIFAVISSAAFAERCNLERIVRAADPRARNRTDPHQLGTLFDHAGFQASNLSLGSPWFALRRKKSTAAARQRDKDEGADEVQTNSARHPRRFDEYI